MEFKAFDAVYRSKTQSKVRYWFFGTFLILLVFLFLPWTQNIKTNGSVTTLEQDQRPQELNSQIPGRIVKWYVKEGDMVKAGDTLLILSEIKEDYLDPNLVKRTQEQLDAKKNVIENYNGKVITAGQQIEAMKQARRLKLEQLAVKLDQLSNKLKGERAELSAANNELNLARDQLDRQKKMFEQGLVSQTQLQQRELIYQNAVAKQTVVENKLAQTQQDVINTKIEQSSVNQDYTEKISKTDGERFTVMSQIATGNAEVAKLENQVVNYTMRNKMYTITAPQSGQIVQARSAGIGEIIKEGDHITLIVPDYDEYAVEMYVRPVDLPLIVKGQRVRFMFDGFPAIVFSGWPAGSYGTFGGRILAFENNISPNGMFRVLVTEDKSDRPWPNMLKIGSGAQGITLLKDVPIWYELWRNINGFPPDFYTMNKGDKTKDKDAKKK